MIYKPHKAFSLTELIIVLVIIALLFAAMAPIITKRHISDTAGVENIWNFVNNDTERNAYFDPGYEGWTSSLYVGMFPKDPNDINRPAHPGKLIVNSGDIEYDGITYPQPQFQFRFSPDNSQLSNGIDAGALGVDSSGNIYFGEVRPYGENNNGLGSNNTILGFSAVRTASEANGVVAIGTGALELSHLENAKDGDNNWYHVTAVGTNAGSYASDFNNGNGIYIGNGAGVGHSLSNIGIGYHAFYSNGSINESGTSTAHNNVAVGINAGISAHSGDLPYSYNVLINNTVNTDGGMNYNTIIGYDSYNQHTIRVENNTTDSLNYITAIGSNACASIKPGTGFNTCIGYRSGAANNNSPVSSTSSLDEHIYLGGVPSGFSGRGVMEVHTYPSADNDFSASGVDVVLNSNLAIRGKLFISDGNDIANYKFIDTYDSSSLDSPLEPEYYRCTSDQREMGFLLVYNGVYVCNDQYSGDSSRAYPRTINILYRDGNAPNSLYHSDLRLKNNIVENHNGLKKLLLLEPYNYTFKQDKLGLPQVGVIAQDLQKVFPESVSKDSKGFLKIQWDEMFFAMINSIKELSQKVDETVKKIADMSKEIIFVKSQQKDIRKKISSLDARVKRLERK